MTKTQTVRRADAVELRLFIEELACNICRFTHVSRDKVAPQSVRIKQEVQLGAPNAFADIVVNAPRANYIVEVVYGYSLEQVSESMSRKSPVSNVTCERSFPAIGNWSRGTSASFLHACASTSGSN